MRINFDSIKPVYIQIAEAIEDDIIYGKLQEGDPAYSQLMIAKELNVNPATAAKGINVLVQKGILEKQRGLSMIVAQGSYQKIMNERKSRYFIELVGQLVSEAKKINLLESDVIQIIKNYYKDGGSQSE